MSSLISSVLNELKSENQRLENELIFVNKCLNVLFKFKTNLIEILNSNTSSETICLTSEDIQLFKDIDEEYNIVLAEKSIKSELNEELNELIEDLNNKTYENKNLVKDMIKEKKTTHLTANVSQKEEMFEISNQLNDNNCRTVVMNDNKIVDNSNKISPFPHPIIETEILPIIGGQTIFGQLSEPQNPNSMNSFDIQNNKNNVLLKLDSINANSETILLNKIPNNNKLSVGSNKEEIPERLKCDVNNCQFSYGTNELEYWTHLKNCHEDYKPFKCDFCDKRFPTVRRKKVHFRNVHSNKTFKCHSKGCEQSFNTKYNLLTHQLIHTNETPFKCDINGCNFGAKTKRRLNRHKKDIHSNQPFICKINGCLTKFKTKAQLNRHFKFIHTHKNKSFKCDFEGCDKEFPFTEYLRAHKKRHSTNKISCDWTGCQYSTNIVDNLKAHKRSHSTERKFVCIWPECGKAFKMKATLETHHRIHTNEKPYSCEWPGCEYRCRRLSSHLQHKRVHNKIKDNRRKV